MSRKVHWCLHRVLENERHLHGVQRNVPGMGAFVNGPVPTQSGALQQNREAFQIIRVATGDLRRERTFVRDTVENGGHGAKTVAAPTMESGSPLNHAHDFTE